MRTSPRLRALLALVSLASCAPAAPPPLAAPPPAASPAAASASALDPRPAPPQPVQLPADSPWKTASKASFLAPKGWFLTEIEGRILLEEPDRALSVTLLESAEPDAVRAIEQAWSLVRPGFARRVKQAATPPATDGWDQITQLTYETTSAESRRVIAVARRQGAVTHVTLIDGSLDAVGRRGAQMGLILSSFKPVGIDEERFDGKTAHLLDAARLKVFEEFVESARARAEVPGAAVGVIQGGKVVFEKGFGVRALGKKDRVTPETLFMIGSITKQLTTLMMARLVDEGKFRWETPVAEVLPSFALADAAVTARLTMRHAVCACTGLPQQDTEFFFGYGAATPASRVAEMRSMKTTSGFGEVFQYSNAMVSAGGYAAAHAAYPDLELGRAYDAAMKTRVFEPLGMTSTTLDNAVAERREHAVPHGLNTQLVPVPLPEATEHWISSIRPAGGAWSNVRDMERDVMMELGLGKTPEGKAVVSQANLLRRREPQVAVKDHMSYGLGLFVEQDHGAQVVWHTGGTLAFKTLVFFLPEHGVGAVVLTNAEGGGLFVSAVRRRLLELLFDGREEADRGLVFALQKRKEAAATMLSRLRVEPDRAWLEKLVGSYANPGLGTVRIRVEGGKGLFDAGLWKSAFGQITEEDGRSTLTLLDPPWVGFNFLVDESGGKPSLRLDAGQQKYLFERQ